MYATELFAAIQASKLNSKAILQHIYHENLIWTKIWIICQIPIRTYMI